jgi:hypothetical protein
MNIRSASFRISKIVILFCIAVSLFSTFYSGFMMSNLVSDSREQFDVLWRHYYTSSMCAFVMLAASTLQFDSGGNVEK